MILGEGSPVGCSVAVIIESASKGRWYIIMPPGNWTPLIVKLHK